MKRAKLALALCCALTGAAMGCGEPTFRASDPATAMAAAHVRSAQVRQVTKAFLAGDAIRRALMAFECPPGPPPLGAFRVVDAEYQGEVCIGGGDPTYTLRWKLDNGDTYFGQGLVVGDRLIVGFNADGAGYGVAAYELGDEGGEGTWSSAGAERLGRESIENLQRLLPLLTSPEKAEGKGEPHVFAVSGRNPDGSAYEGDLEVLPRGATTLLTWRVGDEHFRGVGLVEDGLLAVGWGTTEAGLGVMVYRIEEDKLHGSWAFVDDQETRVENLVLR